MKVTLQVLGGEVVVSETALTVGDAKDEMDVPGYTATVNGEPAEDDEDLVEFDFVTLSPSVKGGTL